ncbi:acyltransferase family protein [Pseudomonas moraviensis]|uniref:acyltransferase family protein n=1 Tax=Pseudomonas moraviensis TaxID=321662 RepID=UPI000936CCEF|nr:acyltransferase [Pseudomonas moraviensis]OJT50072.1 hypothetical protein BSZ28_18765 [Pseudomonas moraviensis]
MEKNTRYSGADGIRGFACLIVVFVHASAIFFSETYMPLAGTGKIGVWLFFVLSAFLLTSKFESSGFSPYQLFSYALGRFLRIIPLFSIVVVLYYIFGTAKIDTTQDLKAALLLTQGFAHLWTIPVEFKFYLALPVFAFLLVAAKRGGGQAGAALATVALIGMQQWAWPYWETPESSISTHFYLSCFTIGCYCAVSIDFYRKYISGRIATALAVFVIGCMVLSSPIMRYLLLDMPMDKWLQNKFVYLSVLWGVFILALADGKGAIGCIMQSSVMKKIGAWSFSVYLIHWYFYITFGTAHPNSLPWMAIGIVCAIVGGAILHYAIEAPIEKFRHSIQKRIRPPVVVPV